MAAFYKYVCRFPNCSKKCSSLVDLIDHVEFIHIERDPVILQKQELSQPPAVALSYVNCFFSDTIRRPRPDAPQQILEKRCEEASENLSDSFDSVLDDLDTFSETGSDDSCHSWSTNTSAGSAPHSAPTINGSNSSSASHNATFMESLQGKFTCLEDTEGRRRFMCTVPGCGKKYKNVNGIKYHVKNGHNKKESIGNVECRKSYVCHCGKSYKSQSGMRHHQNTHHGQNSINQHSGVYPGANVDARMENNFKQPRAKQNSAVQALPPVSEMYHPQNVLPSQLASPGSVIVN